MEFNLRTVREPSGDERRPSAAVGERGPVRWPFGDLAAAGGTTGSASSGTNSEGIVGYPRGERCQVNYNGTRAALPLKAWTGHAPPRARARVAASVRATVGRRRFKPLPTPLRGRRTRRNRARPTLAFRTGAIFRRPTGDSLATLSIFAVFFLLFRLYEELDFFFKLILIEIIVYLTLISLALRIKPIFPSRTGDSLVSGNFRGFFRFRLFEEIFFF